MKKFLLLLLLPLILGMGPISSGPINFGGSGQALDPGASPTFTGVTVTGLTPSRNVITDANSELISDLADEGTGQPVRSTSPTLTTPTLTNPWLLGPFIVLRDQIKTASAALVYADCVGGVINNRGQVNDVVLDLPLAVPGMNFTVILGTTVAKYFRLNPDDTDNIYLDGVTTGLGKYIGVPSAVVGNAISCVSFEVGVSDNDWFCSTIAGAWAAEP